MRVVIDKDTMFWAADKLKTVDEKMPNYPNWSQAAIDFCPCKGPSKKAFKIFLHDVKKQRKNWSG